MKDNWEALVNAIVLKAVDDYRKARRRVRRFPGQKGAQEMIREVERFFRSRWFMALTDTDGRMILEQLGGGEAERPQCGMKRSESPMSNRAMRANASSATITN